LVAVAVKVYAVPLVRLVTVHWPEAGDPVGELTVQVRPPGDAVTVKLEGIEPEVAAVTVTVAEAFPAVADGACGGFGSPPVNVHHVSPEVGLPVPVQTAFTYTTPFVL